MNYTLAVFKSRFATLNFANLLRANNVPVAIINTPQVINGACGISVKFLSDYFSRVQTLISKINLKSFDGFYAMTSLSGRMKIIKL